MAATQAATPVSASANASIGDTSTSTAAAQRSSSKDGTPSASEVKRNASPKPAALPRRDKASFTRVLLDQYITRDHYHASAMKETQARFEALTHHERQKIDDYKLVRSEARVFTPSRLYGTGYNGYGNRFTETNGPPRIVYPPQKPRPGRRVTPSLRYSRKDMSKQAEQHEELVPIRIDVEWDKIKLRDTFTWNLHDRLVSAELFAAQLVEDFGLKPPADKAVYDQVLQQIHEQLNDFYPFAFSEEDALDPELPYSAYKNDEMRILVKLNITIGQATLMDQFEWEINNPVNSPEEFALSMTRELCLASEFTTAIAHSIREQAQLFTRSLYGIGHPFDGRPIEDPDLLAAFLPSPLPSVFRPQQQAKDYTPYLYELSDADLEKNEKIVSREQRLYKRTVNRRGGPQLPDLKDRQSTVRTLVVSSTIPGAAMSVEESRLYKRAVGAPGGRGRRAARDGDLSDSDESEDSAPDSPAISQLQGTARTRGLRGAASAAQLRMANIGRSETPEATIHHHETRTSRRFGRETTRDGTEEPHSLIITLRLPSARLRRLTREGRVRATPSGSATPATSHSRLPMAAAVSALKAPTTPSAATSSNPPPKSATPSAAAQAQIGRLPAPPPPPPGQPAPTPPPPPDWLQSSLQELQSHYPYDAFEGAMRYCAVDTETEQLVSGPPPTQPIPPNIKFMYLPRIRCRDCPGKLYTPGPDTSVGNFEVHLKNRLHREKVDARVGKSTAPAGQAPVAGRPAAPSGTPTA